MYLLALGIGHESVDCEHRGAAQNPNLEGRSGPRLNSLGWSCHHLSPFTFTAISDSRLISTSRSASKPSLARLFNTVIQIVSPGRCDNPDAFRLSSCECEHCQTYVFVATSVRYLHTVIGRPLPGSRQSEYPSSMSRIAFSWYGLGSGSIVADELFGRLTRRHFRQYGWPRTLAATSSQFLES